MGRILDLPPCGTIVSLVGKHILGIVDGAVRIAGAGTGDRRGTIFAFAFGAHVEGVLCKYNSCEARKNDQVVCANHFEGEFERRMSNRL